MSDFVDVVEVEVGTVEVVEVLVPGPQGPQGEQGEQGEPGSGGGAVDSVNTQTGDVVLDAGDVGADPAGTAAAAVATHAGLADPHPGYLTPAEGNAAYDPAGAATGAVAAHEADTTNVHGIADTANLVYTDDVRLADDRDPTAHATSHQDGGSDELALDGSQITSGTVADARIASTIARDSEVATAVSDHAGAVDPHADRAYTDTKVSTHEADTTNVHGIPDTSALVVTSDARLSDARTPTAHAASHVTGGGDTIASAVASGNAGLMSGADKAKLDGVEAGATADQSAAELLTAIKTVDGSGSGLDADLLDGQSSAAFQPVDTDLTDIAGLAPTNNDFLQRKSGAWTNRTPTQALADFATLEHTATDFSASGLTGATSGARFVGATTGGAPTSGTFAVGDWVVDQQGSMWVCTVAGTPGTWVTTGSGRELAHAEVTSTTPVNFTAVGSASRVDLDSGLSITFTAGQRPFYLQFHAPQVLNNTATNGVGAAIVEGTIGGGAGTVIQQGAFTSATASAIGPIHLFKRLSIAAGTSKTYKIMVWVVTGGTGVVTANATGTQPFIRAVEL